MITQPMSQLAQQFRSQGRHVAGHEQVLLVDPAFKRGHDPRQGTTSVIDHVFQLRQDRFWTGDDDLFAGSCRTVKGQFDEGGSVRP